MKSSISESLLGPSGCPRRIATAVRSAGAVTPIAISAPESEGAPPVRAPGSTADNPAPTPGTPKTGVTPLAYIGGSIGIGLDVGRVLAGMPGAGMTGEIPGEIVVNGRWLKAMGEGT